MGLGSKIKKIKKKTTKVVKKTVKIVNKGGDLLSKSTKEISSNIVNVADTEFIKSYKLIEKVKIVGKIGNKINKIVPIKDTMKFSANNINSIFNINSITKYGDTLKSLNNIANKTIYKTSQIIKAVKKQDVFQKISFFSLIGQKIIQISQIVRDACYRVGIDVDKIFSVLDKIKFKYFTQYQWLKDVDNATSAQFFAYRDAGLITIVRTDEINDSETVLAYTYYFNYNDTDLEKVRGALSGSPYAARRAEKTKANATWWGTNPGIDHYNYVPVEQYVNTSIFDVFKTFLRKH